MRSRRRWPSWWPSAGTRATTTFRRPRCRCPISTPAPAPTTSFPASLKALFNFRYSTASRADDLRARTEAILRRHGLDFRIDWWLSGEPFLTPAGGALRETVVAVCRELCGIEPEQSTGGGTSDGRFIAPLGAEVVELGPVNASIHKVDECVAVADLERLPDLYAAVCARLLD